MSATQTHKGPWTHRLLVYFFTVLFGVLIYWLLGFVMRDRPISATARNTRSRLRSR